ncbi:unnamed protein product [Taenia asiatica]|uniref:C2H2-type domain-containing protein n=1 Tax=Taenia asiatica TaxID=60517 RepID=A0A158R762_TAEAS|nr:unnamed protein product [Taenia asiatica]
MNPSMAEPLAVNLTVNFSTETPHIVVPPSAPPEMEAGNSGCIYCLTKVVHPRLGRGESYACGYKPYRCEICNYSTVTKGNLAIHEQSDRHLNNVQVDTLSDRRHALEAHLKNSRISIFNQKDGTCQLNDFSPDLLEVANHTLFCQICGIFGTDSVEELISHAEQSRIPNNLDLANQQLTTHMSGVWHCNLCAYRSPLKANFQLHCKTEKHAQRLSLLLHMWEGKEGGLGAILPANNLLLSPSPKSSLYCQLRCLPCGFFTCSVHKMRVHCQTPVHGFLAGIFGAVVRRRSQLKLSLTTASEGGSAVNGARVIYACRRCEMTCTSLRRLMQHFQSTDFHDPFGRYLSEPEDVTVLWEINRESEMQNHNATMTETSQLFQVANVIGPDTCPKEAEGDSNARTSSPVLVPTRWENEMSQPLLTGATRQTLTDAENVHCKMNITADPLCSWLNSPNLQNSELLQELVRLVDEQKQQINAPRTCDGLFAWFGADNSFCSFIICWLKYQFPQMGGTISDEFVALVLELIAQQPSVSGRFSDLRELQQRQAFSTCQQCSPPRPFLLPSSMSLHFNIHHNEELPALILEAVKKMENTVIEVVRALQPQQFQVSPMKRGRTRLSVNQLEVLRSTFCSSNQLTEAAIADICEKTGLKEKVVKHWFQNTLFKERQRFKDDPSTLDISQPPSNQASATEHSDEMQLMERTTKPASSTKRFRTPISSIQQTVLLQYFQADQNPSRRQMDIISSKVNLPKRVVQVWFQNARSRERRTFIKHASHQSQSPKPNFFRPSFSTPPWQPREASTQATTPSELKCSVSGAKPTNAQLDLTSVERLQQIFNRILAQIPPLGIIQLPPSAPGQPAVTSTPQQLPSQPFENYEMDSPLDLSTVPYRSNDNQSSTVQNLSPHASSTVSVNETRSDTFCRRNRTSISSTQARFMQWFFQHHKTPTICECENIGRAIGLSRRVVQVWFQNQRAKEKKLARATAICSEASLNQPKVDSQFLLEGNECKLCDVKIKRMSEEDTAAVTEHIFSKAHIDRLFATICQGDSWSIEKQQHCLPESKHE